MKRIVIDCDPGMDDAVAMILALSSPELQVEAITSATGNLPADKTSANVLKVLDLLGAPEIPVAQGSLAPLLRPSSADPFSHGEDGLGNTRLPDSSRELDPRFAPDLIADVVRAHPGAVTIVATAPLTNLALALQRAPDIAGKLEGVIAIAGSFGFNQYADLYATGGNPASEWNVYVDPEAADMVFRSGVPLMAIGVDVWARPEVNFSERHLETLRRAGTPQAAFVLKLIGFVENRQYQSYTVQIDAMAVAAAIDPTLVRTEPIQVAVETVSPLTLGQTVVDRRRHHRWSHLSQIEAAYEADFERYLDRLVEGICTEPSSRRASRAAGLASMRTRESV